MNSLTPSKPTAADETIVTIPWAQLHDSPLQYRKTYSDATIAEIAATITDTGRIHQPLVVRLNYPNPLFRDAYDPQDGFEIVFGHSRKRGGMLAGLAGAPCVVRNMTDAQVRAAQAAENIARADVHPIEEAEGFRAMLDQDQITADELAATLGKSRSYVYGRLKLLALCPDVRRACLAGEIGTEVGLLIARVGGPKMQTKALGYIDAKYYSPTDGGKKSFRQIRDLLNERFTLDLKDAIFDVNDEILLPSAGYCGRCPKRSGNAPEFADITEGKKEYGHSRMTVGADICTDPDCFDAKKKAHLAREAAKLAAAGKTVITGNKARAALTAFGEVKGAFVELKKVKDLLKNLKKSGAAVAAPQTQLIQDQRTGKTIEVVARADLQGLGVKAPEPTQRGHHETAAEEAKRKAYQDGLARKLAHEVERRRDLLNQVRTATRATPRSEFDLRLVAMAALEGVPWGDRPLLAELWGVPATAQAMDELVNTLDLAELTQLLMDCALVRGVVLQNAHYIEDKPEALLAAAKFYGIRAGDGTTPTPSSAGASAVKVAACAGAGLDGDTNEAEGDLGDEQPDNPNPNTAAARPGQMADAGFAGGTTAEAAAFEGVGA